MKAFSEGKRSQRFSALQFEQISQLSQRAEIFEKLSQSILFFLDYGQAVSLEGFGVVIPHRDQHHNSYHHGERLILREEAFSTPRFEKCDDLTAYPRNKHAKLVETRELARKAYLSLPLDLQLQWSEAQFRAILLGAIQYLKREVVVQGYSSLLHSLGEFFALHNRQGSSLADWFAGADIFLTSENQTLLKAGNSRVFDIPVLNSATETFEALNGPALANIKLDAAEQLKQIGYLIETDQPVHSQTVSISVFHRKSMDDSQVSLLYCSDGFRNMTSIRPHSDELPCELVLQLELPKHILGNATLDQVPAWPLRLFAAAWVLAHSSKSCNLRAGLGLSLGTSLVPELASEFQSILLCDCNLIKLPQRCDGKTFRYLSLTAITEDEAQVSELYSTQFLLRLLQQRYLDQLVKPKRPSLISKTGLLDNFTPKAIACTQNSARLLGHSAAQANTL